MQNLCRRRLRSRFPALPCPALPELALLEMQTPLEVCMHLFGPKVLVTTNTHCLLGGTRLLASSPCPRRLCDAPPPPFPLFHLHPSPQQPSNPPSAVSVQSQVRYGYRPYPTRRPSPPRNCNRRTAFTPSIAAAAACKRNMGTHPENNIHNRQQQLHGSETDRYLECLPW